MSSARSDLIKQDLTVPCPQCFAVEGAPCTRDGAVMMVVHVGRRIVRLMAEKEAPDRSEP